MRVRVHSNDTGATCLIYAIIFAIAAIPGGWSVNYLLAFFGLKTLPFLVAVVISFFTAQFSVALAIVLWVLRAFGVV
ncbi:MAG TPA: hypothetical protein PKD55_01415 [Bellilinea sp.]|nr:hypothetical protein [Bellilinea sp.]